jgi:hypothetical protein
MPRHIGVGPEQGLQGIHLSGRGSALLAMDSESQIFLSVTAAQHRKCLGNQFFQASEFWHSVLGTWYWYHGVRP